MLKMMWFASLLIFISIGGRFCDDDDNELGCFWKNREKCEEHLSSTEFPRTGEELLAVCRNFIAEGSCLIKVRESCPDGPNFMINYIRNAVDYVEATCQEDTATFKAITNNFPCVERVVKSRPGGFYGHCSGHFSEDTLEAVRTHIQPFIHDESKEDLANCLFDLMDVTCEGITFGYHCGEEVKAAAEEIEAHVHSLHLPQCTSEQLEELSPFMRTFEGLLVEDLALQNALERKRK